MFKRVMTVVCVLLLLPVLAGLSAATDAHLMSSTMNRIVGGCDACSQWTSCGYCLGGWKTCTNSGNYVGNHLLGEDPDLGYANCTTWDSHCGFQKYCDDGCKNCYTTTQTCAKCIAVSSTPEYELCPGDWPIS